jgi:hypothetical protein
MLELGPRRPKKERVPNSDEEQGPPMNYCSIFIFGYWRWVGVARELETDDDCSIHGKYRTVIQTL